MNRGLRVSPAILFSRSFVVSVLSALCLGLQVGDLTAAQPIPLRANYSFSGELLALAGTIVVTSTADTIADDGLCTLREAITAANTDTVFGGCAAGAPGLDILDMTGLVGAVSLGSPLPDLSSSLKLDGPGAALLTVQRSAATSFSVFHINSGTTVEIDGLTISGGQAASGGGVMNDGGALILTGVSVLGNSATSSGGGVYARGGSIVVQASSRVSQNSAGSSGGGIYADNAALVIQESTVEQNSAGSSGGGVLSSGGSLNLIRTTLAENTAGSSGGGVFTADANGNVVNSTLSGNDATVAGGGWYASGGTVLANNVTVAYNTATDGGGVAVNGGSVSVANTLLGGNSGDDCAGSLNSLGYNLFQASACVVTGNPTGNVVGLDPMLASLVPNGGSTATHMLQVGSPAINAGNPSSGVGACEATDQRAVARPLGVLCDIGSTEVPAPPTPVDPPINGSALRGLVKLRDGSPLAEVSISVLDYPEYGATQTASDGTFTLPVAQPGGILTLKYEKQGYLPAQRQVTVRQNDYVWTDDVVLIPVDSAVTTVAMNSPTMQVARGSIQGDEDGIRQATLLIPAGTQAEVILPDGLTQPVGSLHLHLTEYTVGASGPDAMPGELPPNVGYTYAVEFTAEEAIAKIDGKDVLFNQPVNFYVDNFLNFDVGMIVPVGYYDNTAGRWIASNNGLVIKILSVSGGMAVLDVTGDDIADSGTALEELSITDAERQQLASLYLPGKSLWRSRINHLSTYDCNDPWGPPADAEYPEMEDAKAGETQQDSPVICRGSTIACENQSVGESVDVTGTPFSLHYSSERAIGRGQRDILEISLSGESIPSALKRIDLEIYIAGRRILQSFPPLPNQSTTFVWDRTDVYGRVVDGTQDAQVRLGYVYDGYYYEPDPSATVLFAFGWPGYRITDVPTREDAILWQEFEPVALGVFDTRNRGIGGWTVNIHHYYDPYAEVLYMGDGTQRSTAALASGIIETFAGGAAASEFGDGGPATQAAMYYPYEVATGPDGSVYIGTSELRVRRVDPDGIIHTFAGTGEYCIPTDPCGDGGLATQAQVMQPNSIAVDDDGTVYIADGMAKRIRKVGVDGIITAVAGTGYECGLADPCGDGGPATAAQFYHPRGVAISSDGSLYVADGNRIRRVGPDGIITTVAGTGEYCNSGPCGDGGPAWLAQLSFVEDVAVGPDGALYIAQWGPFIRRVGTDGIITTFAGTAEGCPEPYDYCGDGGPAKDAGFGFPRRIAFSAAGSLYISDYATWRVRVIRPNGKIYAVAGGGDCAVNPCNEGDPATSAQLLYPYGVAVGPDGSVYIADYLNHRVRRVRSAMPALGLEDILIPSEDGAVVYVLDNVGQHLRTLNALTGATLYTFAYDASDRLSSITDADGNVTTIQRDAAGQPTGILSPYGQLTTLQVNAEGYLSQIVDPLGHAHTMTYQPGGLLATFTDPLNHTTTLTYDANGRLTQHENAADLLTTLARTDGNDTFTASITSPLNRTTATEVSYDAVGNRQRTITSPSGLETLETQSTDAQWTYASPNGSSSLLIQGSDARWGMLAPLASQATVSTPGGLTFTASETSSAVLATPGDPFSLTTLSETLTVNGRTYSSLYDAASRTFAVTTPTGRGATVTIDVQGRPISEQTNGLAQTAFAYDSRGRLTNLSQGGRTVAIAYNGAGFIESITDPLFQVTSFAYDAAGRLTSETLPGGRTVTYTYDAAGNLTSLTPPGRPAHLFTYNTLNLPTSYAPPDVNPGTDTTTYTYNADRQWTNIALPDGRSIAMSYDAGGRPSVLTIGRGSFVSSYSPTTGQLTSLTSPDGVTLGFSYDGALLLNETLSGAINGSISRVYDNNFGTTSLSVNGAPPIGFTYDDDGLLTGAGALTLTRNPQNGLLIGSSLALAPNALTDSLTYNTFGEVLGYEAQYNAAGLFDVEYTRDALGRIDALTETLGGATSAFDYTYDTAGRLSQVHKNGALVESYTYDLNGNRLTASVYGTNAGATYDSQDRLLTYGGATFTYSAGGDLQTRTEGGQTTTYSYDELGNLIGVGLPNGTAIQYLVDGSGRRVGVRVNGALQRGYLWQSGLRIAAELDSGGAVVSRFVYATGVNVPDYMIRGGNTYRLITDHLGSVRLVVNLADGTIAQRIDYDAWGNVLQDTNSGFQPFGFAGGLYDPLTKLVRFGARDYDARVGRWTTKDPIGFGGGDANLYAYTSDDPANFADSRGFSAGSDDPDLQAVLNHLYSNPKIGGHILAMNHVKGLTILVRFREGTDAQGSAVRKNYTMCPIGQGEVLDLIVDQAHSDQYTRNKFRLSSNLENIIAHELGHIWAKLTGQDSDATAIEFENATRPPDKQRPWH